MEKAYIQALRGHQAQEAIMGYQSIPVQSPVETPVLTTTTASNGRAIQDDIESEDEDDQPVVQGQGVSCLS